MKERLTHNLGLKILSVVLAAFVWLMIMSVADPVVSGSFSNIPVRVINDDVFTTRGYQYTIESGEKVDIRVRGKRSRIDSLSEADFVATADLNSINSMYMVPITVECTADFAGEIIVTQRNETMAIKLEDQEVQPYNVRVVQTGEVKEGYYCYETRASSTLIQVTGSVTQMQSVKEVIATVDVSGMSETFTADCELEAYDYEGNAIDLQKLSFSQDVVTVTVGICPTKQVDIRVAPKGLPADGYYVEKIEYAPQTLLVAAESRILSRIDNVEIPCSVDGADSTVEVQLDAGEYLSTLYEGNCYIADNDGLISVIVTISPVSERILELSERSITPVNLAEGLSCDIYSVGSFITVRGPADVLEKLSTDDLGLYIDLAGCISGTYSRQVRTDFDERVSVEVNDVMVRLSEAGETD